MPRILVINPNSSNNVTAAIDEAVAPLRLAGGPAIDCVTLAEGPAGIASQRDSDGVVMPLCRLVEQTEADAFVLACFSDPGLHAVREAAGGRPVMGIAEWGLLRALTLGERFGIIALSEASVRRHQRMVRQMGLGERYAGSWPVELSAADTTLHDVGPRLAAAGRELRERCRADVVVLGCAGMARHRASVAASILCPVVEPTQQAVAAALGAVLLGRAERAPP